MGNKSKQNGVKQSSKWASRRNVAAANVPGRVATVALKEMQAPTDRLLRGVIHASSKVGTLRRAKSLNSGQ